ncbi:putative POB3-protein that binds to DNA polymerase I [Testicularia cyperi]|uniref:FACT complex subunit POB3 n=1 Tax=Testicularia cyperi TaxID=1882483 RepID=A0A317XQ33_9BASI|nr:putative POB3-protein that binds to DNA polymerase I [Testicularia cyperi]
MSSTTQWDNIFHGLDATPGKLRMSQGGLGWKPSVGEGTTITIPADQMASFQWVRVARNYQLCIHLNKDRDTPSPAQTNPRRTTFDGFLRDDYDKLSQHIRQYFNKSLDTQEVSTRGWNWGQAKISNHDVQFLVRDKLAFQLPLAHLANSNIAKTEVSMEFLNPEQQQPGANTGSTDGSSSKSRRNRGDQLVEMRLYVPGQAAKDDGSDAGSANDGGDDNNEETAAEAFHEALKSKADIGQVAGDSIVVFKEVLVLTPRGRYDIDVFNSFIRLRGKTYDYKILYSSMNKLFLLPKSDEIHVMLVIGLDPPIRQGQTRYPYLVLQFPREEEMDAELNLDEETIQEKYDGKLKKRYEEPTFRIVTNIFKVLSGQKVSTPGDFESSSGQSSIKCNVKAADGNLYPLEKSMLWVSKQPVYVPYSEIHQAILSRVGGAVASSKTFDLRVATRSGTEHTFQSISREELDRLKAHLAERKVRIKNEMAEETGGLAAAAAAGLLSDDEDEEMRDVNGADDDEDSEEDADFSAGSESDGGSPSEASSDDEDGDGAYDDEGDDNRPKKKKKKD